MPGPSSVHLLSGSRSFTTAHHQDLSVQVILLKLLCCPFCQQNKAAFSDAYFGAMQRIPEYLEGRHPIQDRVMMQVCPWTLVIQFHGGTNSSVILQMKDTPPPPPSQYLALCGCEAGEGERE